MLAGYPNTPAPPPKPHKTMHRDKRDQWRNPKELPIQDGKTMYVSPDTLRGPGEQLLPSDVKSDEVLTLEMMSNAGQCGYACLRGLLLVCDLLWLPFFSASGWSVSTQQEDIFKLLLHYYVLFIIY